jgi:dihydrofolate synthase/folylpolyglutamate synthase
MTKYDTAGRIEAIIARLHALYPRLIDLSLGRLERLLADLGHPELALPPVIHVAGTNGKGSTCAFVRAIGEAAGMRVHVTTSPHLMRLNERFRVAGELVSDAALTEAMDRVETVNAGQPITVFEVLTAVAFVLFAQTPADLCVVEVGLGGRGDASNVIARPAACAITSISLDHRELLGDTLEEIAGEKAGIIKPGVPIVTGSQPDDVRKVFATRAVACRAPFHARGRDWEVEKTGDGFRFGDAFGVLDLPTPSLLGAHQIDNAGIAIAALRASGLPIPDAAYGRGIARAEWPARLQVLRGKLAKKLPDNLELWLDGGHNPGAGLVLAEQMRAWSDRPTHLIVGMKQAKDSAEFLRPLLPLAASLWAIAEPHQHLALPVESIIAASGGVARPGPTVSAALDQIARAEQNPARVLICGSLYLAGEVLKLDGVGSG